MSDTKKLRGVVGLANLGNTCYMNSVIQAFRHCPEWTLFCAKGEVDKHIQDKDANTTKVLLAYKDVMKSLWAGTGPAYVLPRGFHDQLCEVVQGTLYEDFGNRTPQDAHEFLVWLLDQMYMATQKKVDFDILLPSVNSRSCTSSGQAAKAWKEAFEKQYSPLTDLLFGLLRLEYTCHSCHAKHTRWETFNTLKVTPEIGHTLLECLQKEFQNETMEDFSCEACKKKVHVTKHTRIWKLPKVLMLTLKRFDWQGRKRTVPLQFDGDPLEFTDLFATASKEESSKDIYNVFATIDHHGGSLGGGHYTSQCYNTIWHSWHLYDDESAHILEKPNFGPQTYMLFLRRSK